MIHSLLVTNPKGATETCNYLASALIAKLLLVIRKYCENEGNTVRSRTDIIAGQVKHYIDTHFDEQFTLQDISDAIRVMPRTIWRICLRKPPAIRPCNIPCAAASARRRVC